MSEFSITSPDFEEGGEIPRECGYRHGNANPHLSILKPAEAGSLALIMDDPDAMGPAGKVWVHWVMYDIDGHSRFMGEKYVIIPFTGGPVKKPLTRKQWDAPYDVESLNANNKIMSANQDSRHGFGYDKPGSHYGVSGAKIGVNDFDEFDYGGPDPPDKRHTYVFKAYAPSR